MLLIQVDSSIINYYYTLDAQFTITIPKEIEIGQDKQAQYDISVFGSVPYETQLNIEPVDNVNDVDGINFYMIEKEGKQAVVNIKQNDVDWKYNEINDENGTIKSGTINADNLDAGEWEGSFSFGINSHKHEFKETIEGDVCAEKGTINYVCQDCDYSYSEEVEAVGHDWQEDNSCSRCDLVAQPFTLTKSNMYMTGLVSQEYGDYDSIDELSGDIVIPETFEYDGVTYRISSIGDAAFYNCSNITSIKIPNSVTTIGEVAFYKDYNLSGDLVLSDNVTNIEYGAFAATNLSSVTLGINVESIGEYAFYNCKNLSGNLIIHDKVTNIGAYAFANCYSLTNLKIGNSVTTIGIGAFQSCLGLSGNLVIPNNVIDICELAFYDCENLTSLTLGNRVENIKYGAFGYCINLSGTLTLPDSVTTLGGYAFYYCNGLTGLVLDENLTSIGTNAFVFDLNNLTSIVVEEGNQYYDSRDNCNAIIETSSNKLILGCQNTIIPDSVTSIGAYAFSGCTLSGDLVISSNITSIGNYAFRLRNNDLNSIVVDANNTKYNSNNNCNAIIETSSNTLILGCRNTVIPNNVKKLGNASFAGCLGLTSLDIPDNVTSIGDYAFEYCSNLSNINIPNSITSIGIQAFYNCTSLKTIFMPSSITSTGTYTVTNQDGSKSNSYRGSLFLGCSPSLIIYCEPAETPSGWFEYWNYYDKTNALTTIYGITREQYETQYKQ